MPKKAKTPFAHHALERACERYGICLTKKQQLAFGRMLSNPKYTIRLTRNRLACYFEGKWYLLACAVPTYSEPSSTMPLYTVQTFLRPEDATEEDKQILRHNERYLKINNDAFHVLPVSHKMTESSPQVKRMVELPADVLTGDELPHDEIQSAESILKTLCDKKQ